MNLKSAKLFYFKSFLVVISISTFFLISFFVVFFNHSITHTVYVTEAGFEPDFLEVTQGSTVVWINKGEKEHWPASDFHPTHSLYPSVNKSCIDSELDACRPLKKGEKFQFKFGQLGTWGIHDHLFPGLTMKVKVIKSGNKNFFSKVLNWLNKTSEQEKSSTIEDLSREKPQEAWEELKRQYTSNNQVLGNVHKLAHIIGNNAYSKLGIQGIIICDSSFAFGCFHGITEKMLLDRGSSVVLEVQESCLKHFPREDSNKISGCIHGVGHGLLGWSGLNYHKALKSCDQLSLDLRNYCYDGVFMEFSFSAPNTSFDPNDPWRLCNSLEEGYQHSCSRYQVSFFQSRFNWDFGQIVKGCLQAPSVVFERTCFNSLGYLMAQNSLGNFEKIRESCNSIAFRQGMDECFIGSANEVVFQKYTGWETIYPKLCEEVQKEKRQTCLQSSKDVLKQI